jgi:C4-dicarboxylate-binding protein DctP
MRETTVFANQIAQKENDDALAAIRASGLTEVHDLTAAERAEWRKVLEPVQTEMETRVGKDLVTAIRRETDANP